MLRKDKVVNILPGKGSWLGEFFDPAEPEDYWETPHVHHVTWWYLVLSWRLSHRLSCRSCQLTFQGEIPSAKKCRFCTVLLLYTFTSFSKRCCVKRRHLFRVGLSGHWPSFLTQGVLQMYRQALSPLDLWQSILAQSHRRGRSGGSSLDVFLWCFSLWQEKDKTIWKQKA